MQKLDRFQTFIEGQFRKGDVVEITINGATSKFVTLSRNRGCWR